MTTDPIDDIERRVAFHGMGGTGYALYRGARDEGASRLDAMRVVAAWFVAITHVDDDDDEPEDANDG